MNSSSSVAKLATALCLVQAEITDVEKDAKSRLHEYATLGAVLKIARPILSKHGICFVQAGKHHQWGDVSWAEVVSVETILIHESGEWISSVFSVKLPEKDEKDVDRNGKSNRTANAVAQQIGIIVSYLKRYGLASMIGITQKDTDAEDEQPAYVVHETRKDEVSDETLTNLKHYLSLCEEEEQKINQWLTSKHMTLERVSEQQAQQFIDKLINKLANVQPGEQG